MPKRRRQGGLTLIELVIALAIAAALATTAAPHFGEMVTNSRMRAAGNLLLTEALTAQSEAIKRNRTVRLVVSDGTLRTLDMLDPTKPAEIRQQTLMPSISATLTTTTTGISNLDFGSEGRPVTFGTAVTIDISMAGITCSGDLRCPSLRVDAGGAVRLCGDRTNCT